MPRPWPFVMTGSRSSSAASRACVSAPPSQTSEPRTSTGRCAAASSAAIRSTAPVSIPPVPAASRAAAASCALAGSRGLAACAGRRLVRAEQRLERDVEEHRAAVRGHGQPESLIHGRRDPLGVMLGPRPFGDRKNQLRVVQFLQAARAPAVVRGPSRQHDHRRAVEVGGGDRAHPVGHPGASRQHRQAGCPGQPRGTLSGEHGGLLMPDVQQPQWRVSLHRPVVEREHMPAGQREHRGHAVPPGGGDGKRPAMWRLRDFVHAGDVTSESPGVLAATASQAGRAGVTRSPPGRHQNAGDGRSTRQA